ncbi:hypothetical protein AKI39_23475 [Bordetella sp. H567]|uniref:DUF4142 domain-containing protein n=1 Tax=Bordetella sp. H567 TaxID=1697043 RepID=UPI00081C76E0|nr:DUF4142 domain-containing protein [Bordetella sp. H567]AOB33079.1 hypothetical protein AKI39_23475 [Bordetella sp. H567]
MTARFITGGVLTAAALALGTGAWAQPAPRSTAPSQSTQPRSTLASADKDFLENAAQGGHAEIEGSQMAATKSSNADVKQFATQMVQDHTKANEELMALAMKKGYTPPDKPSMMQRTELKALSATSGSSFDKMYVSRIGVAAHEDTVKLFRKAADNAKDPDIKAWAAQTLPTLQHHLDMANALHQKVDGDSKAKK